DVPAREIEMLDIANLELFARIAEIDPRAGRARARHGGKLVERKLPLGQNIQHFTTDIAGRPDDDDAITHGTCPSGTDGRDLVASGPITKGALPKGSFF